MKNKIQSLQDATYELLGLLQLAGKGNIPEADLEKVIMAKVDDIHNIAYQSSQSYPFTPEEEEQFENILKIAEEQPNLPPQHVIDHIEEEIDKLTAGPSTEEQKYAEEALERHEQRISKNTQKPIFTLNDRFLFTRELFRGDKKAFDDALTEVAAMDSEEEAADFFYSTFGWNEEEQNVKDFMKIIGRIFN